jgi:hypothetical protein
MPKRKVVNLDTADANQNSQDLITGRFECKRRIKTCATLLNESEVKSRGVSDRLDALGGGSRRN